MEGVETGWTEPHEANAARGLDADSGLARRGQLLALPWIDVDLVS